MVNIKERLLGNESIVLNDSEININNICSNFEMSDTDWKIMNTLCYTDLKQIEKSKDEIERDENNKLNSIDELSKIDI